MKLQYILCAMLLAVPAFADSSAYVTPDSWSKHLTANGVKQSSEGITAGGANVKIGLTTRGRLTFSADNETNVYQYARARATGVKLGEGEVKLTLNARGAWDSVPRVNEREYYAYWNGSDVSRNGADADVRLYQANAEFNGVLPKTDITLGRLYLPVFNGYKIDGGHVAVSPLNWLKVNAYYGLPVSYYSDIRTQVAGGGIELPIEKTGTKIKSEYSYFMHTDGGDYNTSVVKGRIDQSIFSLANIYGEGSLIGKAWTYEVGIDGRYEPSRTGVSGYITGQYDKNKNDINPYVALYESELGKVSEYFMGGFQVTQGITDYVLVGAGFEGKYNFNEAYGDRDYYRVFGTVDLVGLIHKENFLSLIADYYTVAKYKAQDSNSKMLFGFRTTQKVTDSIDVWAGLNVKRYQYHESPLNVIKNNRYEETESVKENTTLAYIGGMWQVADWCVLQCDYTFEYSDIFKSDGLRNDNQTVELWANFLW